MTSSLRMFFARGACSVAGEQDEDETSCSSTGTSQPNLLLRPTPACFGRSACIDDGDMRFVEGVSLCHDIIDTFQRYYIFLPGAKLSTLLTQLLKRRGWKHQARMEQAQCAMRHEIVPNTPVAVASAKGCIKYQ